MYDLKDQQERYQNSGLAPALVEENYFSATTALYYMSASQYKSFLACEAATMAELRGEYTPQYSESTQKAFLVGSYVDAALTGDLDHFKARHPELFSTRGKTAGQLKSEFVQAETMVERVRRDPLFMALMSGQTQTILTGKINGVLFKGKADVILDEAAVERIRRDFPEAAELFEFCDSAIIDLKTTKDFETVWDDTERRRVSWIRARRYDIQGAIYQALAGGNLPFILAAVTKQDPPDLLAVHIPDSVLSAALEEVRENAPRFQRIKLGLEPPHRCEKCAYCRATRRLMTIEEYTEEG